MRTVQQIYDKYKILPSLQMHMLRVAAVSTLIADNYIDSIDKKNLVTAALFHDMANIIKADLTYFPQFVEPEGLAYWQGVKDEFIQKYGENEVKANEKILQEINLPDRVIAISNEDRFSLLCVHVDSTDVAVKIMQYSDYRASPHGIVSYDERMAESKGRYEHLNKDREEETQKLTRCGKQIEKQIFERCKIRPEDITEDTVQSIIDHLRNSVVE